MKTSLRIIAFVVFSFLLLMSDLFGQETITLTIEQAIRLGLETSKALHLSSLKVAYADAKRNEANASRLPSLKASGAYTRLSSVPPFEFTGSQLGTFVLDRPALDNYNFKLSLEQPLFTGFGLESRSDIASYSAQAAEEDNRKDKNDLVYNVQSAYWNLYKAREFEKVIDENVEQVKAHLNDVQNSYDHGIVTKNELLKVEVQLSNTQILQIDARNNARLAKLALNNVLGIPLETETILSSEIRQNEKEYDEVNSLVRQAIEQRPDIQAMNYRVKASKSGVTLARSGWFPQIYASGNYYYSRPNHRYVPTIDQFNNSWDVNLSASFDLWNWGMTANQTDQADALLAQTQDALGQLRNNVTLEVTQFYLNLHQSRERVGLAQKAVTFAEENYHITNEKFKSGLALNSDMLDAEAALLQAKWNYIQSLVDHELSDVKLQQAIGNDLSSANK